MINSHPGLRRSSSGTGALDRRPEIQAGPSEAVKGAAVQCGVGLLTRAILIEDTCKITATAEGRPAVTSPPGRSAVHSLVGRS